MSPLLNSLRPLALICGMVAMPLLAHAELVTVAGKMNGYNCVVTGFVCPVDKKDPVAALETDFVLQLPDGKYYFLPNLERSTKVRYFLDSMEVTGDLNSQYNAIQVEQMKKRDSDGSYSTVWSADLQKRQWSELATPGSTRP